MNTGVYGWPVRGGKVGGTKRLQTEMTIRNGQIVYDLNGLSEKVWTSASTGVSTLMY